MKNADLAVLQHLNQHVDHFDNYADGAGATNGVAPQNVPQKGNPNFSANFSAVSIQKFFTLNTGTGAFTAVNANNAGIATMTSAFFLFGTNDFYSGYASAKTLVPLSVGAYGVPFIFGKDYPVVNFAGVDYPLDATARAVLRAGDVVMPITAVTAGPQNSVVLSIMRCQQVSYSTLLLANSTNSFLQKGIRMNLNDSSANGLLQFNNALFNYSKSWLGKFDYDSTDINANNQPTNFKTNIIDIPLQMGITKDSGIVSYVGLSGYGAVDNVTINLSNFAGNVLNPQK